jgi:hypothetical protein
LSFYFDHPRDLGTGLRSQKVGSLKDFEVRDVPEKGLPHNEEKAINPFGTVICPK